jgi:hypothetical protein
MRDFTPTIRHQPLDELLLPCSVDNLMSARVVSRTWGGVDVKRCYQILVLFLLAGVFAGSAIPLVDLPETAFDESDAPVNLAPPSQAAVRFVRPISVHSVSDVPVMPGLRLHCAECVVSSRVLATASTPRHRDPHSLQDLLCTFLI